ncbi:hypothetical protein Tco_0196581 [Tanacetum coccineum]
MRSDVGSLIASGVDLLRQDSLLWLKEFTLGEALKNLKSDYNDGPGLSLRGHMQVHSNYNIRIDTSTDGKNHKVGLDRMERVLQLQRKVSGNLQAGGEYEDKDEDFRRSPYKDKDTEDIRNPIFCPTGIPLGV